MNSKCNQCWTIQLMLFMKIVFSLVTDNDNSHIYSYSYINIYHTFIIADPHIFFMQLKNDE